MRLNLRRATRKHGGFREVPGNYAGVVGESNMSTLLPVVPRVFVGLPLICELSPGDRAQPHIGGRARNRASADRLTRASQHRMRDA